MTTYFCHAINDGHFRNDDRMTEIKQFRPQKMKKIFLYLVDTFVENLNFLIFFASEKQVLKMNFPFKVPFKSSKGSNKRHGSVQLTSLLNRRQILANRIKPRLSFECYFRRDIDF